MASTRSEPQTSAGKVALPAGAELRLTFASETVKRLSGEDFDLGSKELITLRYDDCILVLFHIENAESYQLATIWALVARQVAGPVFGAVNMLSERRIAEAMTRLKTVGSHPLHWASLRQYPFILVYRNKWPVAVYNGPREVQALIDYALTLACEAGYYETKQLGGSMQAEGRYEMGPYQPYTNIQGQPARVRDLSVQYNAEEPIRGFNPSIPVVATGGAESKRATGIIQQEETVQETAARQGIATSLTENVETGARPASVGGEPARQALPPAQTGPAVAVPARR